MQLLDRDKAIAWCAKQGIDASARDFSPTWRVGGSIEIEVEPAAGRAMALGYRLLMASSPPDDTVELFAGGLVWITETGIWSPQTERVGIALLRSFAFACTGRSLIGEVTAILVGKDELIEAQAALYIALLFKWDALLVHEGTQTFFRVSHHGIVIATSSSATMIDSLRSGLMDGGWRVRDR